LQQRKQRRCIEHDVDALRQLPLRLATSLSPPLFDQFVDEVSVRIEPTDARAKSCESRRSGFEDELLTLHAGHHGLAGLDAEEAAKGGGDDDSTLRPDPDLGVTRTMWHKTSSVAEELT
jgi:hypothetical protein